MNIEKAKYSPSEVFDHPNDVLSSSELSKAEKRDILISWKNEEIHISESQAENMKSSDERFYLQAINDALIKLGEESAT